MSKSGLAELVQSLNMTTESDQRQRMCCLAVSQAAEGCRVQWDARPYGHDRSVQLMG